MKTMMLKQRRKKKNGKDDEADKLKNKGKTQEGKKEEKDDEKMKKIREKGKRIKKPRKNTIINTRYLVNCLCFSSPQIEQTNTLNFLFPKIYVLFQLVLVEA